MKTAGHRIKADTGQPQALGTCGGGAEHLPQSSTEAFRDGGGVTRFAFAF